VVTQTCVSIVLPVRNGATFLENSIRTISGFAREFDEIIVIDDGSTDLTPKILKGWSRRDIRVKIVESGGVGLAESLNLALTVAKNNWIARADVDDTYSPERLTEQIKLINSKVVAIFSDYNIISASGRLYGRIPTAVFPLPVKLSLISGSRTPHPIVLMNRTVAISAGGYLTSEFPAEDLGLWVRMQEFGFLVSSPKSLLNYLVSNDSVTSTRRTISIEQKRKILDNFRMSESEIQIFSKEFGEYIESYKKLSNGYERIFLLYRDILNYNLRFEKAFSLRAVLDPVIFNPKMIIATTKLLYGFALRRIMRLLGKIEFRSQP
jgi:glycosyltransferase involved in cell wall biosynthesis